MKDLVSWAEEGWWGAQDLPASAGIYSTGMIGFGDEDDIPPLDEASWRQWLSAINGGGQSR